MKSSVEKLYEKFYKSPFNDETLVKLRDALVEQDDERGAFITLQMRKEVEKLTPAERKRERELLKKNKSKWLGPLSDNVYSKHQVFRRGFLSSCVLKTDEIDRKLKEWRTVEHLNGHCENGRASPGKPISISTFLVPNLAHLRSVIACADDEKKLHRFVSQKGSKTLETLTYCFGNRIPTAAELDDLSHCSALPELKTLTLNFSNSFYEDEMRSWWIPHLPTLLHGSICDRLDSIQIDSGNLEDLSDEGNETLREALGVLAAMNIPTTFIFGNISILFSESKAERTATMRFDLHTKAYWRQKDQVRDFDQLMRFTKMLDGLADVYVFSPKRKLPSMDLLVPLVRAGELLGSGNVRWPKWVDRQELLDLPLPEPLALAETKFPQVNAFINQRHAFSDVSNWNLVLGWSADEFNTALQAIEDLKSPRLLAIMMSCLVGNDRWDRPDKEILTCAQFCLTAKYASDMTKAYAFIEGVRSAERCCDRDAILTFIAAAKTIRVAPIEGISGSVPGWLYLKSGFDGDLLAILTDEERDLVTQFLALDSVPNAGKSLSQDELVSFTRIEHKDKSFDLLLHNNASNESWFTNSKKNTVYFDGQTFKDSQMTVEIWGKSAISGACDQRLLWWSGRHTFTSVQVFGRQILWCKGTFDLYQSLGLMKFKVLMTLPSLDKVEQILDAIRATLSKKDKLIDPWQHSKHGCIVRYYREHTAVNYGVDGRYWVAGMEVLSRTKEFESHELACAAYILWEEEMFAKGSTVDGIRAIDRPISPLGSVISLSG